MPITGACAGVPINSSVRGEVGFGPGSVFQRNQCGFPNAFVRAAEKKTFPSAVGLMGGSMKSR